MLPVVDLSFRKVKLMRHIDTLDTLAVIEIMVCISAVDNTFDGSQSKCNL